MSEAEKAEDMENMENMENMEDMGNQVPAGTNVSALSAESQDFRLVDMDDFDDDLSNADTLLVEKERKDFAVNESADSQVGSDTGKTEIERTLTNDNSERNKPSKGEDDASSNVTLEEKARNTADEKPGSINADTIGGKRKAESDDEETTESAKKVLKMSILDDAKTLDKRKLDKEDDESSASDNSCVTFPNKTTQSNVIIEETQDMDDEAAACATDEIFKEDLGEKKSVNCKAEECETMKKHFGPLDELDKDENLNNSTKSVENVSTEPEHPPMDGTGKDNVTLRTDDKANSITNDKVEESFVINCESKENFLMDTTDSSTENAVTKDDAKSSSELAIPSDSIREKINLNFPLTQDKSCPSANNSDIVKKKRSEEDAEAGGGNRNVENNDAKEDDARNWASKDESSPAKKEEKVRSKVPASSNKSRMSIEVIFDSCASDEKISRAKELVEIDEEGEKIVLDSSQEDSHEGMAIDNNTMGDGSKKVENVNKSIYGNRSNSSDKLTDSSKDGTTIFKSDGRVTNDSSEYKRTDTDTTVSLGSDLMGNESSEIGGANNRVKEKDKENLLSEGKDVDHSEPLLSISENEVNVSKEESSRNKSASDSGFIQGSAALTKALQVEKEIGIYVKLKCLLEIDESSKELLAKELIAVQCESTGESSPARKINDTSAELADISGNENKDSSPGSVHSNPQLFGLNPSRLSIVSSVSSSSSASSAASLAAKLMGKDSTHFSLPRAPAKQTKKPTQLTSQAGNKFDELFERLTREWKNSQLLTTNVLNFLNTQLGNMENCNASSGHLDEQIQKIRSSTPEVRKESQQPKGTPKSTRRGKPSKRPYLEENSFASTAGKKNNRQGTFVEAPKNADHMDNAKMKKHTKSEIGEEISDDNVAECELIGKEVFAKWSDNNYYPGKVVDKVKAKYKVNFYDGHSKLLIEAFVIRLPKILNKGLSVYATTTQDDYGSSGIIVDVEEKDDGTYYTVETDDKGKLEVRIKDIFLSPDQAQVFKEEVNVNPASLSSTPKHLGQITLDNTVDGKRRSRRVATPVFSTPKSRKRKESTSGEGRSLHPEPSGSGVTPKGKRTIDEKASVKSEDLSSDSSVSVKEEFLFGVHPEAIGGGTPNEQSVKGTQRKIKGKARSKKRTDDEEIIQRFGPIPRENSNLFAGMSFLLTCASLENIDRFRADNKESNSETATENEEQWVEIPFVRDRLKAQITAGGGKIYDEFDTIPEEEYEKTKLITNVPNNTAKSLLCLSVGIPSYNHKWIVRCCQQNTIVNPAEEELPTGWSLEKQCYVEKFQRANKKPLINMIVIIPNVVSNKDFVEFWRQICENAGAVIVLVDNPESMEGFVEDTVVVTNHRCPPWAVEKAYDLHIPLLSTTWVVQCLVEGKVCAFDAHPRYKYNYVQ